MYINELKNKKWKVKDDLKIQTYQHDNIPREEQETVMVCEQVNEYTLVNTTKQNFFSTLYNSELFELDEVIVSSTSKDYILGVRGRLPNSAITIRTKTRALDEAQRLAIGERLKASLQQNKKSGHEVPTAESQ